MTEFMIGFIYSKQDHSSAMAATGMVAADHNTSGHSWVLLYAIRDELTDGPMPPSRAEIYRDDVF